MNRSDLNDIILDSGTFPKLEKIVLVRLGGAQGLSLNKTFWEQIPARPITYLDISYMHAHVLYLNEMVDYCTNIRIIRARGLHVSRMFGSYHQIKTVANLEVLDLSEYYVATNLACIVSFVEDESNIPADIEGCFKYSRTLSG